VATFSARGAHAEPPAVVDAQPEPSPGVTPREVDAWFERANQKFAARDYAGALELLERACAHSDFPGCALNLGAVHHALRHCLEARKFYESYLRGEPSGERAGEARAALDELDAHCQTARSSGPVAPSASPPSEAPQPARVAPVSPPTFGANDHAAPHTALEGSALGSPRTTLDDGPRYRAIAASVTVLGGAAGLTSLYLGLRLGDANAEFEKHKRAPYDDEQAARLERARDYRALTIGSGVAAAALLGVGGVFWWLGVDSDTDVSLAFDAGSQVRLSGQF
jgi:hypothetical protein